MKRTLRGTREGIIIAIALLSAFVFFLFAVVFSYSTSLDTKIMSQAISPLIKYQLYFMISVGALGIAVGATVFYFMSHRVDSSHTVAKKSAEVVLRFLSPDERMVMRALLDKEGKMLQSELSRSHGLSKVKAHRVISKLSEKGIVTLTSYGKTNRVQLQSEIYEALR